jgi:hypothetical protein
MLTEVLGGIRRFQLQRPPEKRLHWNRVLLYVWPVVDLPLPKPPPEGFEWIEAYRFYQRGGG